MNKLNENSNSEDLLCRTCLIKIQSIDKTIHLFESYLEPSKFVKLIDFLTNFTSLQIHEADELSPFICTVCYDKIKDIHSFRNTCIVSHEFLIGQKLDQERLTKVKTEQEEDYDALETEYLEEEFLDQNDSGDTSENTDLSKKAAEIVRNEEEPVKVQTPRENKPKKKTRQTENKIKEEFVKITCEICQKMFLKQHTYDGHMRKHRGLKQFACDECGKDFAKKDSLKHHMETHHPTEDKEKNEFICGINDCGKIYSLKQSLRNHIFSVHVPRQQRVVVCEHCGKSFASISGLKKHSYIHTGEMPFKCHLCSKTYPTNHKLKVHIMRHQGIKNHICPTCGLRKTTMHELRVHMNYHTTEKQYPCKLCSAVFSNIGNMTRHTRIVHCGIKAFACTYCDRSFGKADTLRHHTMTHTGEKPHECNVCGKRFIQSIALKTHMKTHNKVKPSKN